MFRKQFIEDKETFTLDQPRDSRSSKVKKYIFKPLQVILLAAILSVGSSFIFDTPEEYTLKQENAQYLNNLALIQTEMDSLNATLAVIQEKDDQIYRLVLGLDPLADEIRNAGIGGSIEDNSTASLPSDMDLGEYRKELNQLNAKMKVQTVSFDELTTLATDNINRLEHRPSIYPIAPKDLIRFSSGFGYRTHPIFKIRKFHKGIDLTALKGSPIYSTAKGKVIIANNFHDGYGNKVVIDHGYGYKTVYAHLHKIEVKIGQEMDLGSLIGQVGNTGISVSPHLHYEVRLNDVVINPLDFVFKDISSEEYLLITQR
jgi:murein DD-endopeptidase MepM/ murein hydrolase activator NlpD